MSWGVWLALSLALAGLALWAIAIILAVSTWKRLQPTIMAYAKMFSVSDS